MKRVFLLAISSITLCPLSGVQEKRKPIPDAAAQKESLKLIRDVFKDDYARRGSTDRQALARKLLQQGLETKDDPVAQYVLLQESRSMAAEVGDLATALGAVEELSRLYEVDRPALKYAALATARLAATSPEQFSSFSEALLTLTDEAVAAQETDIAEKASTLALTLAKAAKSIPLVKRTEAKAKEIGELKTKLVHVSKAKAKLVTSPDDADANLTVGRFLCLVKGDWEAGWPHLAKGSDASLKLIAGKEMAAPKETADQVALADAWWDRAEKEASADKEGLKRRAAYWYGQAIPNLTGLSKARAEKRMPPSPSVPAGGIAVEPPAGLQGHWTFDEASGAKAADSSGKGSHGAVTGGTWKPGARSGALEFDGNDYVTVEDAPGLNPTDAITIAVWFRTDRWAAANRILEKGVDANFQYVLEFASREHLRFGLRGIKDIFIQVPSAGEWHHFAGTYDGSVMRFYGDGILAGEGVAQGKIFTSKEKLYIGTKLPGSPACDFFTGYLDDLRIYDRAISEDEVRRLATPK